MNKIVKNTLILTAITVVSGLLLGVVYGITKEPIARAQENTRQEAYRAVLPDAASFEETDGFDADGALSLLSENGYDSDEITSVVTGTDDGGNTVGYVITVMSHEAYDGDLELSVGIASDGTVKGVEMLSINETAGLGMKADESEFKDQFKDKNVEQFVYTKNGEDGDNMIDAISGATITTNAVTNAVDSALVYYHNELSGSGTGGDGNE